MARLQGGWKSNKLIILSVLLLMMAVTFGHSVPIEFLPQHHATIYIFMQLAAIAVSFAIALQAWMAFPFNLSNHQLYISALLLLIGWFKFGHVFTYEGMALIRIPAPLSCCIWRTTCERPWNEAN